MTIEELKQAYAAATKLFPAPWERDEYINQIYCAEDRGAVVADPRGWGYLTSFLGLPYDTAVEAQKANARLIVEAVNNLPKLLKVAEAAQTMLDAIDKGAVDSEEIVPVPGDGHPYRFHEEWAYHTRKALEELSND